MVRKRSKPTRVKASTPRKRRATAKAGPRRVSAPTKHPVSSAPDVGLRKKPPGRPEQRPAFFADARHATDALAEELGEGFVLNVTSGEDTEEFYEREREEEEGGPFLETSARTEFAYGVDDSNPEDAEPAPWPAVSPGQPPPHRPGGPR
jgi:hypothetical protein